MLSAKIGYFRASLDPAAAAYIAAVEAADGQALEPAVRTAINNFVVGCKADGIWSAIKASCILCGSRTLSGALVPLVGTAPTNFNFVAADYNRKTGLVGNGSNKYLNSNRNNNADPRNSQHLAVHMSGGGPPVVAAGAGNFGTSEFRQPVGLPTTMRFSSRSSANSDATFSGTLSGFIGKSRSVSQSFTAFLQGAELAPFSQASQEAFNGNLLVFARTTSSGFSTSRLTFYSIGESLSLSSLNSRVTALYNAIGAAIP